MNDLSVTDLNVLIRLVDLERKRTNQELKDARLTYIRFCLVEKAIEVNGGVDA